MACRSFSILTGHDFHKLHIAAIKGNLGTIEALLQNGVNVNIRTTKKITPLHLASQQGHLQVVKLLIKKGADINSATNEGVTPLHVALQQRQLEVSEFLISQGADVNVCDSQKWTPLHNACFRGFSLAIVKTLLERGSNIHARNINNQTALHLVLESHLNHLEIAVCLIENGAEVNAIDNLECTPLLVAVSSHSNYRNRLQVIEALLKKGADVNVNGFEQWTPLHFAAEIDDIQLLELLIKYGADVNSKNDKNGTPLHIAVQNEKPSSVNILIQHGADVNAKIDENAPHPINHLGVSWVPGPDTLRPVCFPLATPLHLAAMAGNDEIIKSLLDNGACFNASAPAGKFCFPIEFAMVKGSSKAVELLRLVAGLFNDIGNKTDVATKLNIFIERGGPVNARDSTGRSALFYASEDSIDAVKILLQNKADVGQISNEGVSALFHAVCQGKDEIVDVLLKHAVRELEPMKMLWFVNARRKDNTTALLFAIHHRNFKIVKLLLEYGLTYNEETLSDSESSDQKGHPQEVKDIFHSVKDLFEAVKTVDVGKAAELLQKDKCIVNARDKEGGATPLHWAVNTNHTGIVQLLLGNGANPTFVSYKGNTPLHIASSRGNDQVVKLLLYHFKSDMNKLELFVNTQTKVGRSSALHVAATGEVVKTLLQHGAIYNIKNKDGKIPLDIVKGNIKTILQVTNEVFEGVSNGNTAIIDTCKELRGDVFRAITNALNEQEQRTVLQITVTNGLKYQYIAKELSELMKTKI